MKYLVSYEHSLASAPNDFIVQVPSQLVTDVPVTIPRVLLPEFPRRSHTRAIAADWANPQPPHSFGQARYRFSRLEAGVRHGRAGWPFLI